MDYDDSTAGPHFADRYLRQLTAHATFRRYCDQHAEATGGSNRALASLEAGPPLREED